LAGLTAGAAPACHMPATVRSTTNYYVAGNRVGASLAGVGHPTGADALRFRLQYSRGRRHPRRARRRSGPEPPCGSL